MLHRSTSATQPPFPLAPIARPRMTAPPSVAPRESAFTHIGDDAESLAARYDAVRAQTAHLCAPLQVEDFVVSSMADVSPTKWHLAHTSWFFETFVLAGHDAAYRSPDAR